MKIIITAVEEVGESKIRVSAEREFAYMQLRHEFHKGSFLLRHTLDALVECEFNADEIRETLKNDTREPVEINPR